MARAQGKLRVELNRVTGHHLPAEALRHHRRQQARLKYAELAAQAPR